MFFGRASSVWHSAKLTELRPRQKTPFGRMGRFNFGVYRVCFKCEWGHGARRNGNYFRNRIWHSDVFFFSAEIARRTAIQPKIFFSQPNGEDQSPRSETSATSGILLRNQICVRHCRSLRQFGCSSPWVAKALHRRENQKKKF